MIPAGDRANPGKTDSHAEPVLTAISEVYR
jgi:hypothetical protein